MKDILSEIIANKRFEVDLQKQAISIEQLQEGISEVPTSRSMKQALASSASGIIAEFKRKSPSKGWLHPGANIADVVPAYEAGGASACSILTDGDFFGGSLGDLQKARKLVDLPLLRKDFIIDTYQLFQARVMGADAVLLIAAALTEEECRILAETAHSLQLEVLLEVHSEDELKYMNADIDMLGVNNRNLGTFHTDVNNSFKSAAEECKLTIYDGDSQVNPLWGFSYSRNSLAASESLIEKFATRNDPRAPRSFIQPDPSGNVVYGGGANQATTIDAINVAPNGTPQELQNNYGMSMASWAMTAPTQLISYHEVKFLEAEALCRLGGRVDEAKAALKDAVIAAFANLENTVADAARNWLGGKADFLGDAVAEAYFDNEVAPLFAANPLKETMVQKYLAFFGASGESLEAYNDYRRMKGANENLVELKNPLNSNKFPLRFGYGADDVLANVAIKEAFGDGQYVYSEPVWWAGGSR